MTTSACAASAVPLVPLVIDPDGMLSRIDLLHESVLESLRRRPHLSFVLPGWPAGGKAEALIERCGERGFDYAGNSREDLAVWKRSRRAIVVNVPCHSPKTHPKRGCDDKRLPDGARDCFLLTPPQLQPDDIVARHVSRHEFAQPVCSPGFHDALPDMTTSVEGFFMADTSYYDPEDRSITDSVRVGHEFADRALSAARPAAGVAH